MSVFLFLEKETEQKARIICVHNFPDMLSEEEKKNGVLVDVYNEPMSQPGKSALPYWNYETQEVFFEHIDIPQDESLKQEMELLRSEYENLKLQLAEQAQMITSLTAMVATK